MTLTGEAKGVKQQGGVLDFVTREFEIEVLPADIPESIEVDVTELLMNQGVRIRDVAQGAKWTPVSEPETMLVHVVPMRVEEARGHRRGGGAGCGSRARGHQEGQDRQGRREGKKEKKG